MNNAKDIAMRAFENIRQINRQKILNFIKEKWKYIVIFTIGIAYMSLLIEYSYSLRVPRYLKGLGNLVKFVELEPISDCLDYIKDYKLNSNFFKHNFLS